MAALRVVLVDENSFDRELDGERARAGTHVADGAPSP
jgi:hypothetical protein